MKSDQSTTSQTTDQRKIPPAKSRFRRLMVLLLLVGLVASSAVAVPRMRDTLGSGSGNNQAKFVTEVVKRGPLRITVTDRGQLDSMKNSTLVSNVEGTTTIISIVPEGTWVTKGEVVCELDSSTLVDQERQQRIVFTQAKAELRKAEENLEIQKRQNESDVAAAILAMELARLDLESFKDGEFIQQENEIRGDLTVSQEELARAIENYDFSKRLAKKGYKSQNDVEADRIAVTKAQISLDVARDKLKVLKDYTYKRTIKELEENAAESVRELERVKRQGVAALAQFEAEYTACKLTFEVEEAKLERLQQQIAACKLVAPQDGEVVYANVQRRRSEPIIIEEGTTVRERQAIINLPDLTQMKVDAQIHESRISLVRKGLPVFVRIDAHPNELYRGEVASVSSVPSASDWMRPDLKQYEAAIRLTESAEKVSKLKPGLTAEIEIIVRERNDVLQIPVQSVLSVAKKRYAFILAPNGPERREVLLGESNDKVVEILDGLVEGERVILNPRTHFSDQLEELENQAREREEANETEDGLVPQQPENGGEKGPNYQPDSDPAPSRDLVNRPASGDGPSDPAAFFRRLDANGSGTLTMNDLPPGMQSRFAEMDTNQDGMIDESEWMAAVRRRAQAEQETRSSETESAAVGGGE